MRLATVLIGAAVLLAGLVSWLDRRVDQRVEAGMNAAVYAIIEAQREEIARIRASFAAELQRRQQEGQ